MKRKRRVILRRRRFPIARRLFLWFIDRRGATAPQAYSGELAN